MTIAVENITGGMASAAFVAYLSRLCNPAFTATQYALLVGLGGDGAHGARASGGMLPRRPPRLGGVFRARDLPLYAESLLLWRLMQAPRGFPAD